MAFGDLSADGQADARALVLPAPVQALEDREHPVEILFVEADAVVGHQDLARAARGVTRVGRARLDDLGADPDHRRLSALVELERVADQVLHQLPHLHRVTRDDGQVPDLRAPAGLHEARFQIGNHALHDVREVDRDERLALRRNAGKFQQIRDQRGHARRGTLNAVEVIPALGAQGLGLLVA